MLHTKETTGNEQRTHVDNLNFIYYSFSRLLWTPCGNTRNKQTQLATATLLCDKLHENVARITGPLIEFAMRRSIRKFNIPPPGQPPGHLSF